MRHTVAMTVTIRAPRTDELPRLREIEWTAGTLFIPIGLGDVAENEPASIEALAEYLALGRAWVSHRTTTFPSGMRSSTSSTGSRTSNS